MIEGDQGHPGNNGLTDFKSMAIPYSGSSLLYSLKKLNSIYYYQIQKEIAIPPRN
jgi:hypothetical protein